MDFAKLINENIKMNIVAGLHAGLGTEGITFLETASPELQRELYLDENIELNLDSSLAFGKKGVPFSICGYYDGEHVINRTTIINVKELFPGGQGMLLETNGITVFKNRAKTGEVHLKKLRDYCVRECPGFKGWITIEMSYDGTRFRYRNVIIGLPYDIAYAMSFLYGTGMELLSENAPQFEPIVNFVSTLKLFMYPYNEEGNMNIDFLLEDFDRNFIHPADGYFLTFGIGNKINKAWDELY